MVVSFFTGFIIGAAAAVLTLDAWAKRQGRNWDVTQTTNTARPVYKSTGGPGGNTPAVQFDGTNDFLASAAHWWGSDDLTVFVVMKFGNATRNAVEILIGRSATSDRQFYFSGETVAGGVYRIAELMSQDGGAINTSRAGVTLGDTGVKSAAYRTHCFIHEVSNFRLFIDATEQTYTDVYNGTSTGQIHDFSRPLTIGAVNDVTPVGLLQGSISEIIVYSRALSDSERVGVEQYLKQKWGL